MSAGNSCSGGCGNDLGSSVGLADLAGDPHRHHLRRRDLGLATHPVTSRFPFDTLKMFETLQAGGFTDQQARTLTYVILDIFAGSPPIVRDPPPAAMIESRTQTQR
jgi:hypothetical protein